MTPMLLPTAHSKNTSNQVGAVKKPPGSGRRLLVKTQSGGLSEAVIVFLKERRRLKIAASLFICSAVSALVNSSSNDSLKISSSVTTASIPHRHRCRR